MTLALAAEILSACAVYALLVAWVAHDRRRADRQQPSTQQDKTP